jgi:putative sterol carrier protein
MSLNQTKGGGETVEAELNQQQTKYSADQGLDLSIVRRKENRNISVSNADRKLVMLEARLKNMIKIGRKTTMPLEAALTGFYKEISKSIKRM